MGPPLRYATTLRTCVTTARAIVARGVNIAAARLFPGSTARCRRGAYYNMNNSCGERVRLPRISARIRIFATSPSALLRAVNPRCLARLTCLPQLSPLLQSPLAERKEEEGGGRKKDMHSNHLTLFNILCMLLPLIHASTTRHTSTTASSYRAVTWLRASAP